MLTDGHTRDCYYLFSVVDEQSHRHSRAVVRSRTIALTSRCPAFSHSGPDLIVFDGVGEWADAVRHLSALQGSMRPRRLWGSR